MPNWKTVLTVGVVTAGMLALASRNPSFGMALLGEEGYAAKGGNSSGNGFWSWLPWVRGN